MPDRDDRTYFESRARRERAIAATCEDNAVALAHLRMADAYERRLASASPQQPADSPPARQF